MALTLLANLRFVNAPDISKPGLVIPRFIRPRWRDTLARTVFFASFFGGFIKLLLAATQTGRSGVSRACFLSSKACLQYFHHKLSSHTDRRQTASAKINIQIPKPVFREGKYPDPEQRLCCWIGLFSPRSKGGDDCTRLKANNEHE